MMSATWKGAYLVQAKADYQVLELLLKEEIAACHWLHYLQMCTEKLGKAVALAGGQPFSQIRFSHKSFVQFLRTVPRNHAIQKHLDVTSKILRASVNGVLPVAHAIERLAPALAKDGPNPEYPWETSGGTVVAPTEHAFSVATDIRKPQGRKLLTLVQVAMDRFDQFF
ncbi:MAG: hypothetical protein IIB58_01460 [Planctomycetes bacterium]|nr:hypothetical protein [Planctomycetota bacterium]